MRLFIFRICIMNIIGRNQFNSGFLRHSKKRLIDQPLFLHPMILQFQEKVAFSEYFFISERGSFSFTVHSPQDILLYLSCQTRTQCNDSFVKFTKYLHVHTRLIIISFCKSTGNDLHQIVISQIIFCEKNQMIIPVIPASDCFFIESGSRRHIDLTSKNRPDPCCFGSPVKINDSVHNSVIRNSHTVHSQFLHTGNTFFNFI